VAAANEFRASRGACTVTVHLSPGDEALVVESIAPGPSDGYVRLAVYPRDEEDMIRSDDGTLLTPLVAIVPIGMVRRIDLTAAMPDWAAWTHSFGFGAGPAP
jgi:hypothetical protein